MAEAGKDCQKGGFPKCAPKMQAFWQERGLGGDKSKQLVHLLSTFTILPRNICFRGKYITQGSTYLSAEGHFNFPSNMSQTATLKLSCWIHSLYRFESPDCLS